MPEIFSGLLFVLLAIFQISSTDRTGAAQRRIKGGKEITSDKRYVVYLLKAPDAPVAAPGWTCGGAIVTSSFVVTAAACVDDLERIYVIAGYKKFITSSQINEDKCTKKMKKRVILTCLPKEYELKYHRTESWTHVDIAVVQVDTPFDFTDSSYAELCSYIPTPIDINYWPKYQAPEVDALAMGWGHLGKFEEDFGANNHNEETIKYTPTKILDKEKCLSYFPHNKKMHPNIKTYMICTLDAGNLDDRGQLILRSPPADLKGCISKKDQLMGMIGRTCEGEESDIEETDKKIHNNSRKYGDESYNQTGVLLTDTVIDNETLRMWANDDKKAKEAPGICQNDHGGPLVTWEGKHEILIGVATLFKLDNDSNCMGPYLFTSTYCTSGFLQCILSMENETYSARRCDHTGALEIVRRRISWGDKDDDVIKKEVIQERAQVPISAFYSKM